MNDARSILSATARLRAAGTPFVVATVVNVRGSSYRRPGARLIATTEERIAGSVSGGCLERDLLRTSWWRTRRGPVLVSYDSTDTESPQASLGCGGEVDVLLERANTPERNLDPMMLVERAIASERVSALATVYRSTSESVPVGARWCLSGGEIQSSERELAIPVQERLVVACEESMATRCASTLVDQRSDGAFEMLVEPIVPPPRLFVFGAGVDALPIVESASRLGWNVTVWEPSARVESRARFAATDASLVSGELDRVREHIDACDQALAVVMGHNVQQDGAALSMILGSQARYIGVLGPRHRTMRLASEEALRDARVFAPVGLDIGAETPEEIALSVTAEMLSTLRRRTGDVLRNQPTIHGSS